jgi:hypothetical protein
MSLMTKGEPCNRSAHVGTEVLYPAWFAFTISDSVWSEDVHGRAYMAKTVLSRWPCGSARVQVASQTCAQRSTGRVFREGIAIDPVAARF